MEVTCAICGDGIDVGDDKQIRHVTREADGGEAAVFVILETAVGRSRLLHSCPVAES